MFLVKPSFRIQPEVDGEAILQRIETAGRTCYKSEAGGSMSATKNFCRKLIARGHESVIEHESVTVWFIVDRGVSHELVRHRLASFSQESTRYCNYKGGVTFVIPPWVEVEPGEYLGIDEQALLQAGVTSSGLWWLRAMDNAEDTYLNLIDIDIGWSPQQARSVLPNSTKTELVMTANIREWRHIFRLRTAKAAHPQMREVMVPLLTEFKQRVPVLFEDI